MNRYTFSDGSILRYSEADEIFFADCLRDTPAGKDVPINDEKTWLLTVYASPKSNAIGTSTTTVAMSRETDIKLNWNFHETPGVNMVTSYK